MEFYQFLGGLPAALIPVVLVIYYSNQNTLKWMAERKEIAEAVLAERKEWLAERRDILERQFNLGERLATEMAATRSENHAMRGKLTEFMVRLENFMARLEKIMTAIESFFNARTGDTRG